MATSTASLDQVWSPCDPIEFKRGFRSPWQLGNVVSVEPHRLVVRVPGRSDRYTIEPGRRGKLRKPTAQRLDQLVCLILAAQRAEDRTERDPAFAAVHTRPVLRAVPRPRPRYRSGAYLDYVRAWACCACGAPSPSEAHHVGPRGIGQKADDFGAVPLCTACHRHVTDSATLPHLDKAQTEVAILRVQVGLLTEWAGQAPPDAEARDRAALDGQVA